jgi:hypothetical protein
MESINLFDSSILEVFHGTAKIGHIVKQSEHRNHAVSCVTKRVADFSTLNMAKGFLKIQAKIKAHDSQIKMSLI